MPPPDIPAPGTDRRSALLAAAVLLPAGLVVYEVATMAHPAREDPNAHEAVFAEYAESSAWIAVHLAQYSSVVLLVGGLVALCLAVPSGERTALPARLGLVAASVSLAGFTVLFAVDGVTLKRAVDAWAAAAPDDRGATFAAAQAVRWTEEAVNGFSFVMLGTTLLLVGIAYALGGPLPRWTGWPAMLAGVGFLAHGVLIAYLGFEPTFPALVALPAFVLWTAAVTFLVVRDRVRTTSRVEQPRGVVHP
ncbi:MAG TPA: hypothetical protein VLA97_04025 [Nocardioidaceae bacterium]|nr:hypothetical protein [Nocardioidaceae bacterium]